MGRRTKGRPTTADYTVWTNELNCDGLMIIINGIKNHRINRAKRKLQSLRERRNKCQSTRGERREPNPPCCGVELKQPLENILTHGSRSCLYFNGYEQ